MHLCFVVILSCVPCTWCILTVFFYHVIIFTSTAIALAFGGLYNILVRRFVGVNEAPSPMAKLKAGKLLAKLKALKGGK